MKVRCTVSVLTSAALCLELFPAEASQLSVEPILLQMDAPAAASTLELRTAEGNPVEVQTRVERWVQTAGVERLESTTDVVASPPAVRMAPNTNYVVRIVRVSKAPVIREESYRVLVDELPNSPRQPSRAINLLIRQSIPVFFRAAQLTPPDVSWRLSHKGSSLIVTAKNDGDEHLRIASLHLTDASGRALSFGNGLVGYVLGHSSMSWTAPSHPPGFALRGSVRISAQTNKGVLKSATK